MKPENHATEMYALLCYLNGKFETMHNLIAGLEKDSIRASVLMKELGSMRQELNVFFKGCYMAEADIDTSSYLRQENCDNCNMKLNWTYRQIWSKPRDGKLVHFCSELCMKEAP